MLLDAASHLGVDVLPWNRALDAVDLQAIADFLLEVAAKAKK